MRGMTGVRGAQACASGAVEPPAEPCAVDGVPGGPRLVTLLAAAEAVGLTPPTTTRCSRSRRRSSAWRPGRRPGRPRRWPSSPGARRASTSRSRRPVLVPTTPARVVGPGGVGPVHGSASSPTTRSRRGCGARGSRPQRACGWASRSWACRARPPRCAPGGSTSRVPACWSTSSRRSILRWRASSRPSCWPGRLRAAAGAAARGGARGRARGRPGARRRGARAGPGRPQGRDHAGRRRHGRAVGAAARPRRDGGAHGARRGRARDGAREAGSGRGWGACARCRRASRRRASRRRARRTVRRGVGHRSAAAPRWRGGAPVGCAGCTAGAAGPRSR